MSDDIIIRKYLEKDRKQIRKISYDTAFLELPTKDIFANEEITADILTNYFVDYEPELCFVAVNKDRAIGYIVGTLDTEKMKKILWGKIIPVLLIKALRKKLFLNGKNLKCFLYILRSYIKGEFHNPKFLEHYPATLHINIEKEFRGKKIGAKLVDHYMKSLTSKNCSGIHFGTMSESAKKFFMSQGFSILYKSIRSYLNPYTGKNYPYYILGKKLK